MQASGLSMISVRWNWHVNIESAFGFQSKPHCHPQRSGLRQEFSTSWCSWIPVTAYFLPTSGKTDGPAPEGIESVKSWRKGKPFAFRAGNQQHHRA
jgi:hypothetical protein